MALQKIVDDMRTTVALDATKLAGAVPSGSLGNAPDPDLTPIRSDIAILALKESAIENRVAYGTNDTFIDHFQDSTGVNAATSGVLKGLTDTAVNASEYVSSISSATVKNQWTIEGFFHANETNANFMLFDLRNNAATKGLSIYNNANKTMTISIGNGSAMQNWTWSNAANAVWDPNQWQRWAVTRGSNKDISMYITQTDSAGNLVHRLTVTTAQYGTITQPEVGQDKVYFGGTYNNSGSPGGSYYMNGYVDEQALSQGIARITGTSAGYSRSAEIVADSYTRLLLHHNNNNTDSSSYGRTAYRGTTEAYTATGFHSSSHSFNMTSGQYVEYRDGPSMFSVADMIDESTANATGSVVSTVQTAASSVSEVSGVYLYEDADGNSTPGTQLKIYFTSNNGVNYYEADSYTAAGTFSGNIKMVKLGKTTMTVAGTQVAMKAVWASQVTDSMVQRLHGWAVNY